MQKSITFVVQTGEHSKRDELVKFLSDIAGVSDKITLEERDTNGVLRSATSFLLEADGEDTGIRFSGIPGGHEFNSLVLALLHASGTELKIDDSLKGIVRGVKDELNFEVFISLSCHNCPDVVQALNMMAVLNPNIRHTAIDGALFKEEMERLEVMAVPTVLLNGQPFASGRMDLPELLAKIDKDAGKRAAEQIGKKDSFDVLIVGGGPAGAASAIYAARKGIKTGIVAPQP